MIGSDNYFLLQKEYKASLTAKYGHGESERTTIQHAVDGAIKLIDALALRDILTATKPMRILEVGTFLGFSLRWIFESTKGYGPRVTSLDPRVRHRIFDDLKTHVQMFNSAYVNQLTLVDAYLSERNDDMFLHDYLKFPPIWEKQKALAFLQSIPTITEPFGHFDFAFVDGDHGFNATVLNVALSARMMPHGGTIVVHDALSWPKVIPALNALAAIGVIELQYLAGQPLYQWMTDHHLLGRSAGPLKATLCDGLAVVKVPANAAVNVLAVKSLLL